MGVTPHLSVIALTDAGQNSSSVSQIVFNITFRGVFQPAPTTDVTLALCADADYRHVNTIVRSYNSRIRSRAEVQTANNQPGAAL